MHLNFLEIPLASLHKWHFYGWAGGSSAHYLFCWTTLIKDRCMADPWATPQITNNSCWTSGNGRYLRTLLLNEIISTAHNHSHWYSGNNFWRYWETNYLRLSGGELGYILACVIGCCTSRNLRSLKLFGCVNIIGHGLEPLRGSTAMWHSFKPYEEGEDHEVTINEVVVPILDGVIATPGSMLKHLQLPMVWRMKGDVQCWIHF